MSWVPRWLYRTDASAERPVASALVTALLTLILAPVVFRVVARESTAFSLAIGAMSAVIVFSIVYRKAIAIRAERGLTVAARPRPPLVTLFTAVVIVVGLALLVAAAAFGDSGFAWAALWWLGLGGGLIGARLLARRRPTT